MLGARSLLWGDSVPSVSHTGFSQPRTRKQVRHVVTNVTALISPVVRVGLCQCLPPKTSILMTKIRNCWGFPRKLQRTQVNGKSVRGPTKMWTLYSQTHTARYYESSQSAYQTQPDPESSRSTC